MLLQQASPGPSGAASPRLGRPTPSPNLGSRANGSPNPSDGASSSNSPRFAPGSPRLGLGGSPRLGIGAGSPRLGAARAALEEEAALERLQTELKDGWTVHTGRDGRLYYCNHVTRTASWLPPAESWPTIGNGSCGSGSGSGSASGSGSGSTGAGTGTGTGPASDDGDDLPYGWEQALDTRGKPYYINHINKTSTYVAPEGWSCDSPPAPRDVVLERHPELGFGFVAGSEKPVLVRFVTDNSPSVGKLEPGDQILCVNGADVRSSAREHVIAAVRACTTHVSLRVCQPARATNPARRSALLSAAKRARLRARPPRVRFADSVQLNGAPLYPPSAFSLGDLCLPPMANVLKVFLENGQTKSFKYDATTTVADVVASLRDKLCITADEHFSLVVEHVKSLRRNKLTLLDPKESLARIASRPGAHKMRCLFRAAFPPAAAAALARRDLPALDYLYLQCCNDVAQERFAPELQPDTALRLAALHLHQHALAHGLPPAKLTVKAVEREFGLERFVPGSLLETMKRKELRRLISHFLKLNSQMTGGQRQLTQLQAKLHYLDIVSGLPSYGAKCFSSSRPERVLLLSPRFGLSQIVGVRNAVPQPIAQLDELEGVRLRREDEASMSVAVFLRRDRVLGFSMEERDAREMALVLAGYYRLATGQELNVEQEREPISEDIAPPYLSQHNVVPSKWSYLNYDDPMILSKKHYAIFSMPPPYHSTPSQSKSSLDTNMNSSLTNRNHSNNSSPLIGYDGQSGLLGHDIHFEKCKRNEEFRLFDPNDAVYLDDGMGFDLQSVLSMELLENVSDNPRLVEAKNEEVLRRVAEMQKLVENSEQYLTENADGVYGDNDMSYKDCVLDDRYVGKETCVDHVESDSESINSKMSSADDAPGILKHSDSLLLLTETINQGLSGLAAPVACEHKDNNSGNLSRRQSQGLSAILNNCGLTDALLALNNDLSQSESDNDSLYTPTNSPIRRHQSKGTNKVIRTSFGLHSPDNAQQDGNEQQNLKDYLKQLREKSNKEEQRLIPCVEVSPFLYHEDLVDNDAELIDLTLIPPPQTPDELDATSQVPQVFPLVPASFADDKDNRASGVDTCDAPVPASALEEFLANVTIQPPTVKVTPAVELTPEQILSYIIPPPPVSNNSTLDRETVTYVNQNQMHADTYRNINGYTNKENNSRTEVTKTANGDIVKGTLSVSEIRNMFVSKSLSEARNSLLLREKNSVKNPPQTKSSDSPRSKRKSLPIEKQPNGNANHVIEYPTVERKGMFSCCSKDKNKSEETNGENEEIESKVEKSDSIPDVCEIRPPPRRKNLENAIPPERPPKTPPTPAPRPRSNSFSCPNESNIMEVPNNHFSTLNNRKLNYRAVCEANERPPPLPKPPLPPVPCLETLRMRTCQRPHISPSRGHERRHASIGSPHFQRNLNAYRNLETDSEVTTESRPDLLPPPSRARNHVRFLEEEPVPPPPPPPAVAALVLRAETAARSLQSRLTAAAAHCTHQHAHGGGEDIDEAKFQRARSELTTCAVSLVGASRTLVGALGAVGGGAEAGGAGGGAGEKGAAAALADCLASLHRLADLAQALVRHTSSPLQTRNLVLRVHDVTAAFRALVGADTARLLPGASTAPSAPNAPALQACLALRAEALAAVLATLLRALRVFSP